MEEFISITRIKFKTRLLRHGLLVRVLPTPERKCHQNEKSLTYKTGHSSTGKPQ